MKAKLTHGLLVALLATGITSCKKEEKAANILEKGTWNITLYTDNGADETAHFSGYEFSFDNNGTVTANKAGVVITGTWATVSTLDDVELVLDFGTTGTFEDLTDDWHVIQQKSRLMELEDVSGNGEVDLLTFERI